MIATHSALTKEQRDRIRGLAEYAQLERYIRIKRDGLRGVFTVASPPNTKTVIAIDSLGNEIVSVRFAAPLDDVEWHILLHDILDIHDPLPKETEARLRAKQAASIPSLKVLAKPAKKAKRAPARKRTA